MAHRWSLKLHGNAVQVLNPLHILRHDTLRRTSEGFRYQVDLPRGTATKHFWVDFPTLTKIEDDRVTLQYMTVLYTGSGASINQLTCYHGGRRFARQDRHRRDYGQGDRLVRFQIKKRVYYAVALEIRMFYWRPRHAPSLCTIKEVGLELSE